MGALLRDGAPVARRRVTAADVDVLLARVRGAPRASLPLRAALLRVLGALCLSGNRAVPAMQSVVCRALFEAPAGDGGMHIPIGGGGGGGGGNGGGGGDMGDADPLLRGADVVEPTRPAGEASLEMYVDGGWRTFSVAGNAPLCRLFEAVILLCVRGRVHSTVCARIRHMLIPERRCSFPTWRTC